ncbi:hypothetical protein [Polaromonas sp. A23]|uniref:hypothetical protein n=1 Tax=Polaromonas sp. A23 TaxID=1944133 RepID=UPI0009875107|nr:hypothetical protein [Polaromonas sp. A23]OOG47579.1 hypothetical protein B0B52_01105 [Polaromonas sp. A23]
MKKPIAILVFTVLHAALSFGLFLFTFGRGMARMETAAAPTLPETIAEAAVQVLYFPFMHLAQLVPGWFTGLWGYLPLLVNSLFWAVVLVELWFFLRSFRARP